MTYDKNRLRALFQSQFNISDWTNVLINLFGVKELRANPEPLEVPQEQGNGYYLGNINTTDNNKIGGFF